MLCQRSWFVVLLVMSLNSGIAQDDPAKDHLKKLQGKWLLVSALYNGKPSPPSPFPEKEIWTITKNKVIYPPPRTKDGVVAGPSQEDEITVDASKKPNAMDIRVVRAGKEPKLLKAIFSLDVDELRICVDIADKGRPGEFESKTASGRSLITLKRIKE